MAIATATAMREIHAASRAVVVASHHACGTRATRLLPASGRALFRHQPPVHSPIAPQALVRALGTVWSKRQAHEATDQARRAIERLYPGRHATLTSSGTVALTLAMLASGPGKPSSGRSAGVVALPAYACPDVGSAAIGAGFEVQLYDIDPRTFDPDLDDIEACVAGGATHVVVAHLCGRIVDVEAVARITRPAGVVLIEDAAQHAGGTFGGERAGSAGDLSILSFGRGKGLNAGGGGAMLGPSDAPAPQLPDAPRAVSLGARAVALAAATTLLSHPNVFWLPSAVPALGIGDTTYHSPRPPAGIGSVSATLLMDALNREPDELARRRSAERSYDASLEPGPGLGLTAPHPRAESGALRYPVLMDPAAGAALRRSGVARLYPRILTDYPAVRGVLCGPERALPGARELAARLHSLPTHGRFTARERDVLIEALQRVARGTDAAA